MIGYKTGFNLSTGRHNNFIGYEAGLETTSGANNTFIGFIVVKKTLQVNKI